MQFAKLLEDVQRIRSDQLPASIKSTQNRILEEVKDAAGWVCVTSSGKEEHDDCLLPPYFWHPATGQLSWHPPNTQDALKSLEITQSIIADTVEKLKKDAKDDLRGVTLSAHRAIQVAALSSFLDALAVEQRRNPTEQVGTAVGRLWCSVHACLAASVAVLSSGGGGGGGGGGTEDRVNPSGRGGDTDVVVGAVYNTIIPLSEDNIHNFNNEQQQLQQEQLQQHKSDDDDMDLEDSDEEQQHQSITNAVDTSVYIPLENSEIDAAVAAGGGGGADRVAAFQPTPGTEIATEIEALPEGKEKKKRKVRKTGGDASGGTMTKKKKASSMIHRWTAVQKELKESIEDEEAAAAANGEGRQWEEQLEEWRTQQLRTGASTENANFAPVMGEWRDRVVERDESSKQQ